MTGILPAPQVFAWVGGVSFPPARYPLPLAHTPVPPRPGSQPALARQLPIVLRLKVFVDYQNVYHLARWAFEPIGAPASAGQVHPEKLAVLLQARRDQRYRGTPQESSLTEVRAYRGMPDGSIDPRGHGAATRQIVHWRRHPDVAAITHPVAYPRGWELEDQRPTILAEGEKPREKGIDVQIAVDLVLGAVNDEYDVAILCSGDSDLLPAVHAAFRLGRHVEVAAWTRPGTGGGARIPNRGIPPHPDGTERSLWCHFLDEDDYAFCRDDTDYTEA